MMKIAPSIHHYLVFWWRIMTIAISLHRCASEEDVIEIMCRAKLMLIVGKLSLISGK